jgi:hypothetical protein
VKKKNSNVSHNNNNLKPKKTTILGRKTKETALFAGVMSVRQVCDHTINLSRTKKSINIIINETKGRMFGYDNPLPTVHGVCHSS